MSVRVLSLSNTLLGVLAERLERAAALVGLEPDEFAALQQILLPEQYGAFDPDAPPPAAGCVPTAATPGTVAKVSVMCQRARLQVPLCVFGDAPAPDDASAPEYVLMVRLKSTEEKGARAEALKRLGHNRKTCHKGLPAGCSVEQV